ncbi:hypothetical protein [Cellulosimicrobium phage DS1]|nr:hypothetical protein [Cellulosimicrobium phage DS1]
MESTPLQTLTVFDVQPMQARQWDARNRYAKAMMQQGATNPGRLMSLSALARATESDASTVRRALRTAPGFVFVRQRVNGKPHLAGIYYDLRFATQATHLNTGHHYPQTLAWLAEAVAKGEVFPREVSVPDVSTLATGVLAAPECEAIDAFNLGKDEPVAKYHVPVARVTPASITQTIEAMYKAKDNLTWDTLITTIVSIYHANTTKDRVE